MKEKQIFKFMKKKDKRFLSLKPSWSYFFRFLKENIIALKHRCVNFSRLAENLLSIYLSKD